MDFLRQLNLDGLWFVCFFPESSQMISNTSVDSCGWEVALISVNKAKRKYIYKKEKNEVNAYDNTVLGI